MQKRLILNPELLSITVNRLCHQLIENHNNFENTVLVGLQPRGTYLLDLIVDHLKDLAGVEVTHGYLDTTFYRDDFRRRDTPVKASETKINFIVENKKVVLIDDVLFTGRSVRAAMDALLAYGRPEKVELLVLIDRRYSRDLPLAANYVGKRVNTMASQKVMVQLDPSKQNKVWLVNEE
ncbi:MAG: bifunctional pyr operon transcriptional regulator/uracil phosphoribosyltransferase PyrR [Cyclobacteriaceae bacterium]|nr:bifunctional pyr operon transcriptional regulator/uracil phosphoribosyltransferase PyrR [Cyclobacteriaceae bacterium]